MFIIEMAHFLATLSYMYIMYSVIFRISQHRDLGLWITSDSVSARLLVQSSYLKMMGVGQCRVWQLTEMVKDQNIYQVRREVG